MTKLRDRFWIWGHPANSLYNEYNIDRQSDMSPVDGTYYLGATNTFLVPMDLPCDRKYESELAKNVRNVGWSINHAWQHPEHVTEVCELSKTYKNISRGIFDDFFSPTNPTNNFSNYTPEMIAQYREEMHKAGLEIWAVLYTENFRQNDMEVIKSFIKEFDGISLWFWNEKEVIESYDEYIKLYLEVTEGKKRMVGCYLYDFGAKKEATPDAVVFQLDSAVKMIHDGIIEGVILHTNAVITKEGEEPYKAVEAAVAWMNENGDKE